MGQKLLVPSLLVLLSVGLLPARAQPPPTGVSDDGRDITVVMETRAQRGRLRVAVPAADVASDLDSEARPAASTFSRVLRDDLASSGVFVVQGPEELAILDLSGDEKADYQMYRSLGNEVLVETRVKDDAGRLSVEGRVYALDSERSVLGKAYRDPTGFSLARRIAHTFSDEIVRFFTGRRGIALTSIAFHSDRQNRDGREIYLMDYDGFNQRPITAHETLSMSPDWSPTGDAIAYVSYVTGSPGVHLVLLDDGRKTPVVTGDELSISPAFSPDGRTIALARSVGGGNTEIFLTDRSGRTMRRLTSSRGIDTNPAWSPTGRELAFTSNRPGSVQIYVIGAEGTDLRRVTFEGRYNDGATWSPDGTKLAHSSRREDNLFDIALTDLVTLETRYLTEGVPGSHESPSFSPDGRKLAFASTLTSATGTETQIYIMDLDGGNWRKVTSEGNNFAPSWSGYLD